MQRRWDERHPIVQLRAGGSGLHPIDEELGEIAPREASTGDIKMRQDSQVMILTLVADASLFASSLN